MGSQVFCCRVTTEERLRAGIAEMEKVHIRGSQGSWDAEVTYPDGRTERLPCVHAHYWQKEPTGNYYNDPWIPELRDTGKYKKLVEQISTVRRVIVTTDTVDLTKPRGAGYFQRTGYTGVFTIDEFEANDERMRFRFVNRIANPR